MSGNQDGDQLYGVGSCTPGGTCTCAPPSASSDLYRDGVRVGVHHDFSPLTYTVRPRPTSANINAIAVRPRCCATAS